jgi:hypothetical protein
MSFSEVMTCRRNRHVLHPFIAANVWKQTKTIFSGISKYSLFNVIKLAVIA